MLFFSDPGNVESAVDFKDRLAQIKPRDSSGSRSSSLFVYQQTWALCHLLDLHKSGQDYVVTFDYHEDVTVLNSEDSPTEIYGYQIKTAGSNWTINSLLKRDKGQGTPPSLLPSILGKLLDLKKRHPKEVKLLAFVSNRSTSVYLATDGKKNTIQEKTDFHELTTTSQDDIQKTIKAEMEGLGDEDFKVLRFSKCDLDSKNYETIAKGKFVDFLEAMYPKNDFKVAAVYRALLSEVQARNNNTDTIDSYETLLSKKSISRKRFTEILTLVGASSKSVEWAEVSQRLNTEQVPVGLVTQIRNQWDQVKLDKLTQNNLVSTQLWTAIAEVCDTHQDANTLFQLLDAAYPEVVTKLTGKAQFDSSYLKTCIIVGFYDGSQSKDARTGDKEEESK